MLCMILAFGNQREVWDNGDPICYGGALAGNGYLAVNCHFSGNAVGRHGAVLYQYGSLPSTLINCTVFLQ